MRSCQLCIANLTPFRGVSMDSGTAYEVGFMRALGRPVLGTAESVETIGRDDLFAFLARHYTASNMVLSAAGRVEHDRIVELADKYFGSVPRTPANAEAPAPLAYVGGDGREARRRAGLCHRSRERKHPGDQDDRHAHPRAATETSGSLRLPSRP